MLCKAALLEVEVRRIGAIAAGRLITQLAAALDNEEQGEIGYTGNWHLIKDSKILPGKIKKVRQGRIFGQHTQQQLYRKKEDAVPDDIFLERGVDICRLK